MARLICLANSWRPGGRCIAGIDGASGEWIRPVPFRGGAIPEDRTWLDNRCIAPLDIIEVPLEAPSLDTRFQRENCRVRNWHWRLVGRAAAADVLKFCVTAGPVLHSASKVVEPSLLERLPPQKWASLELVHAKGVIFQRDPNKDHRWQARFSMGPREPAYCITLTDPEATMRLNAGGQLKPECLLTVSLTEPIEMPGRPKLCYKLVAAVIELDGNSTLSAAR
jgi:hypothetical protein